MRGVTMPCADHCLGRSLTGSPGCGDWADAFRIASVSALATVTVLQIRAAQKKENENQNKGLGLTVGLQRVFGEARVPLLSTSDSREQMRRPGLCFAVCWWLVLSARPVPAASPEGSWWPCD